MPNSRRTPSETQASGSDTGKPSLDAARRTAPPERARPVSDGLEELRGLPAFAAIVAHEIRNPLSAVKIALQTVERHGEVPVKDATRLRIALREVATIERVLTNVLDWARPADLHVELVATDELVEAALGLVKEEAQEKRIVFARAEAGAPSSVRADAQRISQALAELLRNAIAASPADSTIQIESAQAEGAFVVAITDRGTGLGVEDCARAFDPFFSKKARGIGLGLPRARAIARRHGGDVLLEPAQRGGSRATLTVPLSDRRG
jgi:two-component system sensor histidine kinase HydH